METLKKLNDILNNMKTSKIVTKKVTFSESIPEPRVVKPGTDTQQTIHKISTPKLTTAIIDKPLTTVPTKRLIVTKPIRNEQNNGPITQSKYAQAVNDIVCGKRSSSISQLSMIELAQAVLDDNAVTTTKQAFEIFDEDTGKLLKY